MGQSLPRPSIVASISLYDDNIKNQTSGIDCGGIDNIGIDVRKMVVLPTCGNYMEHGRD